ncbi:MAG: phosphoglucosamine mutase [Firmicutes bacterium]|nr:phosphoglucosamine mutase [Bacillota bacterium]
MSRLFGTDGVRGLANAELTPELAFRLGRAGAYVLSKQTGDQPKIIIGTDTRRSADMLEAALTAGMCSVGALVYSAGVIPTPAVARLVRFYGLDAGVAITASHNPMQDNGIKFFNGQGYKLADSLEDEIEECMARVDELPRPSGEGVGYRIPCETAVQDYVDFLKGVVRSVSGASDEELPRVFAGMKIALDCANGATSVPATLVFHELGAEVYVINNDPDGTNINRGCGSTHLGALTAFVRETGADAGFAFDGDGDRMLAADELGSEVDGDQIMSVCALDLRGKGLLARDTLVVTVMSNMGLSIMCEKHGLNIEKTAVGDRYVLERMLERGYNFGGEQSGHIIFLDHSTTGDGILSALLFLLVIKNSGERLSRLNTLMEVLPQALAGAKVANDRKRAFSENERIKNAIRTLEDKYRNEGRVLIRPSGTEPLVRVLIEGKDRQEAERDARELAGVIEEELR